MKNIVIKIGSSVLTVDNGSPDHNRFKEICNDVSHIINEGYMVVLVSSGAIAYGRAIAGNKLKSLSLPEKQVLSSIGQPMLIHTYMINFKPHDKIVSQILLTHEDFLDRTRYLNARRSIELMLKHGFIPIINENDAIAVDEIKVGDNDTLSAMVSVMVNAERLIILSNIDAIYDRDPNRFKDAKPVKEIMDIDQYHITDEGKSKYGVGGIKTKIEAARLLSRLGIYTTIADGRVRNIITRLMNGEKLGTTVLPSSKKIEAKRKWISLLMKSSGSIVIDDGAVSAVLKKKSLLAAGIVSVSGAFKQGEVVSIMDTGANQIGKGITNYSVTDIEKIKGKKSLQINSSLGYKKGDEIIHRDNLVIIEE